MSSMKKLLSVMAMGLMGIVVTEAKSADLQVVYSTDFSTDPGWTTNAPSDYYWDSGSQSYYQREVDGSNGYAFVSIPGLNGAQAWRLDFDINKTSGTGASDARFGFWDSDMTGYSPYNLHVNQYWLFLLDWNSTAEGHNLAHITEAVSEGTWRHVQLDYDPGSGNAYAKVALLDGTLIGEVIQYVGPLSGIDRLGMSTIGDGYGGTGVSYIDNVVLQQTPEPATMGLLGVGGVAVLRRGSGRVLRRRRG